MRCLLLFTPLVLAACHREAPAPPAEQKQTQPAGTTASPSPSTRQADRDAAREDAAGAADMLRHYYALIEAGNYAGAWKMRSGGRGIDAATFANHFKAYEAYHSQIGAPTVPVRSGDWIYVEVPVMTTGRFLGGKPFGSSGSVTLRRPAPGLAAPAGEQGWRIYTG